MTPELCKSLCFSRRYKFAGIQYMYQCFCGNDRPPVSKRLQMSQCNMPCTGDSSKICGASWKMNIYEYSQKCLSGWTFFEHTRKCYRSSESIVSRSQATSACKSWKSNADLVSIPDKTTNDYVLRFVNYRSWIGLEKKGSYWNWSDGTWGKFLYWGGGGPSGDGSYVELCRNTDWTPGMWNDLASYHKRGFVCQYAP